MEREVVAAVAFKPTQDDNNHLCTGGLMYSETEPGALTPNLEDVFLGDDSAAPSDDDGDSNQQPDPIGITTVANPRDGDQETITLSSQNPGSLTLLPKGSDLWPEICMGDFTTLLQM
jgi:hypothetical protein